MLVIFAMLGCGSTEPSTVEPAVDEAALAEAADKAALVKAAATAKKLGGALKARLVAAMEESGPQGAVTMCADEAQGIGALALAGSGVRAGRASLRLRNPNNAPPDWVAAWLAAQGERPAEGVAGLDVIADTERGRVARVIRPIAVEAVCLTCHGPAASIPEEVQAVLAARYPTDQATGYAAGDLRGALWAEAPVR